MASLCVGSAINLETCLKDQILLSVWGWGFSVEKKCRGERVARDVVVVAVRDWRRDSLCADTAALSGQVARAAVERRRLSTRSTDGAAPRAREVRGYRAAIVSGYRGPRGCS